MQKLKQGTAAIAFVATLGLIVPGSFGGPASADVSRDWGLQPMAIKCDLDRNPATGDAGYEYVSEVMSADKNFQNAHTVGFQVFKLATLQDMNSSLVFSARSGSTTTTYTALDHAFDAETNPVDFTPLDDEDPRLATDDPDVFYPAVFDIPPGHPYSGFGPDGFSLGNAKDKKQALVDCVVTDIGASDEGLQNWYPAGESDAEVTDCLVDGDKQDLCFVPPVLDDEGEFVSAVVYHYTDIFYIKAHVSNSGGAKVKAASADDAPSADRAVKAKKNGKHRGNGKRGR